jgi:predicted secreted acid phosphatase
MTSPARFHDPSVLRRILDAVRTPRSLVVFDLDSTVLDNRPRQSAILREYGVQRGIAALDRMRPEHWKSWSLADAMARAGLADATIENTADEAKQFWRERFFTSTYCALDQAIPGAADYVRAILAHGASVAYCTGRHEAMRHGTELSFGALSFPLPDNQRVHLVMKPTFEQADDDWKKQAFARLDKLGVVAAVFDNEPMHINSYRAHYADAHCVHVDTDHSGRDVKLLDHIVSVRDFVPRWTD